MGPFASYAECCVWRLLERNRGCDSGSGDSLSSHCLCLHLWEPFVRPLVIVGSWLNNKSDSGVRSTAPSSLTRIEDCRLPACSFPMQKDQTASNDQNYAVALMCSSGRAPSRHLSLATVGFLPSLMRLVHPPILTKHQQDPINYLCVNW